MFNLIRRWKIQLFSLFSLAWGSNPAYASADVLGKVDLGPAYVHIDVLESGKTVKRMDMAAVKGDSTINIWKGLCLKPSFIYGRGHGELAGASIGIGHFFPITDKFCITPSIGATWTYLRTHINIDFFGMPLRIRERFRSVAGYVALDVHWTFLKGWRIGGQFQYAFSRSHTKLSGLFPSITSRSKPKGPSYAILLEHDLNDCWSLNVGAAYNLSLTKEKHGLRAYGFKAGVVRWF